MSTTLGVGVGVGYLPVKGSNDTKVRKMNMHHNDPPFGQSHTFILTQHLPHYSLTITHFLAHNACLQCESDLKTVAEVIMHVPV